MTDEQVIDQFFETFRNRFDALETALQTALGRQHDAHQQQIAALKADLERVEGNLARLSDALISAFTQTIPPAMTDILKELMHATQDAPTAKPPKKNPIFRPSG